jgi:hypothetical protein
MGANSAYAIDAIPNLVKFADELTKITDAMTQQAEFNEMDHLALMCLCFVSKQEEHLKSVRILAESRQYRDAGLIARSMIEGLCILLWAARKPQERPFQWKSYAWIEDYRLMLVKEKSGEKVDPAIKSRVIEQLRIYGPNFLKPKYMKKQSNHSSLPIDPYRTKWIDENVYEICKEVEGDLLYEKIYRETSQWIHWTIKGLSSAIYRDDLTYKYINTSADMGATALASGFQALFESARLLDTHLNLGFSDKLENIFTKYADFHNHNSNLEAKNEIVNRIG